MWSVIESSDSVILFLVDVQYRTRTYHSMLCRRGSSSSASPWRNVGFYCCGVCSFGGGGRRLAKPQACEGHFSSHATALPTWARPERVDCLWICADERWPSGLGTTYMEKEAEELYQGPYQGTQRCVV